MDSCAVTRNAAKEKLTTKHIVVDDKDIVSHLHDSILGYILSFLPITYAIHTSLLSKRWVSVWKSITSLKFDDRLLYSGKLMEKEQFVNLINRVLLHLSNSSIQKFSLSLSCYEYDSSVVSAWISSALERGVRELHVQYADKVLLPSHSLFNCRTLVHLVLQMRSTLCVPIFVCFPNLQYLSLSGIRLVSDFTTISKNLILSFPVLKVFKARRCEWSTMKNVIVQAPLLETFSIVFWNSMSSNESSKCDIKISAPRLAKFTYEGDLEHKVVLLKPSSIHDASIVIVIDEDQNDRMQELSHRAHMLLKQLREVKFLKLWFYKVIMPAKDIFTDLPAFGRLSYLQLNEITCEALFDFLHKSPKLETLVLVHGVSKFDEDLLSSVLVPCCFRSSLKVFQFGGFNMAQQELCLAKFVMGNAEILERMTISTAFWLLYSDINMEKVKQQLLSFPKRSSSALIEFSDVNNFVCMQEK